MYPGASATSLWLLIFMVTLAHCSVEFFIDQTFDQCSRGNNVIACANNTDRGGLCAYAPDANELWCCPAPDPYCWAFSRNCTGGSSGSPGPGQISCSNEGAEWCCDQEYEHCTQAKNQINVCNTNFASANANVSIAEANAVESSSTSSSSSDATSLSSISSTSSTVSSKATTTTSSSPVSSSSTSAKASGSSISESSPSSSDHASKSSSHLSSGAIAGIVVAAVVVVACLVGIGIMRARRGKGNNKAQAMPLMTENDGAPATYHESRKAELDGRGRVPELPSQGLRHEMM